VTISFLTSHRQQRWFADPELRMASIDGRGLPSGVTRIWRTIDGQQLTPGCGCVGGQVAEAAD
jgi:hypothetical protein